jgi:TonB family protein
MEKVALVLPSRLIGRRHRLTWVSSLAVHATVMGWLWLTANRMTPARGASPDDGRRPSPSVERVEAVPGEYGVAVDETSIDSLGAPPPLPSGDLIAHLDRADPGRGGEPTVQAQALNLADADDQTRLSPDLLSRLDRDQLQRLRVARSRFSWDDRRSTTHPAELTLVATGPGYVRERRPWSPLTPGRGLRESEPPRERGAVAGGSLTHPSEAAESRAARRGIRVGGVESAAGEGLPDAVPGPRHRASAPVGMARPSVMTGPVAVVAIDRARPLDNQEVEQEVATTVQSLVQASTAGGFPGMGTGGSGGGGAPGAGGASGDTSRAHPLDLGGDRHDDWTDDPTLVPYFRQLHRRIDPLWADAFPRSALLDLKQGTVILDFTVFPDGHVVVAWPPWRPSGVDEFDRNCADAVRRGAPFPPFPPELGDSPLHIRAPFVARSPLVK